MGRRPHTGRRGAPAERPASPPRRRALLLLGTAAGGWAVGATGGLISCAPSETSAPPGGTRVPLTELPPGSRFQVVHQGFPAELRRAGDGTVTALSLLCTHTACRVDWQPERQIYRCTCHEGLFDADGEVLAGPPERPLRRLPVRVEGDEVVVGEPG